MATATIPVTATAATANMAEDLAAPSAVAAVAEVEVAEVVPEAISKYHGSHSAGTDDADEQFKSDKNS